MLLAPYTAPPDSALAAAPQSIPTALSTLLASQTGGCTLAVLEAILSSQVQNGPYIYDMKGVGTLNLFLRVLFVSNWASATRL
jgi:hypothetical protein